MNIQNTSLNTLTADRGNEIGDTLKATRLSIQYQPLLHPALTQPKSELPIRFMECKHQMNSTKGAFSL